jgi:ABC-type lipoprotein export system ATPase subunit
LGEILAITGLRKSFRIGKRSVDVLRGVDLRVDEGEIVAVTGPSGSGKSTLFNLVGGLDEPTSGSIVFAGRDMAGFSDTDRVHHRQHSVGFVFQSFNLIQSITAAGNVELPLMFAGVPLAERRRLAADVLAEFGLEERAHHRPSELSGGEQQRIAIARAIVTRPRMVLADEPTGSLDSQNGALILEAIRRLNRDHGLTVLLTTHDSTVAAIADRIIELRDGAVIGGGGPEPARIDGPGGAADSIYPQASVGGRSGLGGGRRALE